MTKKDYINIARVFGEAFRSLREDASYSPELILEELLDGIVKALEADNPHFDLTRFLLAVEKTVEKTATDTK